MSYYVWLMTPSLAFHINLSFILLLPSPLKEKKRIRNSNCWIFLFFFYKDFFTEIAVKLNLSACEKCARLFILIFFFFNFANTFSQGQSIFLGEVGR